MGVAVQQFTETQLIDQLRQCGLRATGQRLAILRALRQDRTHPSAEEVYDCLKRSYPTLSLSTVCKTLQTLAEMDVLQTIDTGTGRQRFEGNPEAHHHAVCTRCGRVLDVAFSKFPVELPDGRIDPSFDVLGLKVYFTGRCHKCAGNGKSGS